MPESLFQVWHGLGATSELVPTDEADKENLSSNSIIDEEDIFMQVTQSSSNSDEKVTSSNVTMSRQSYQATTQDLHLEMSDTETQELEG